jgi:hypothetical protein
LAKYRLGVVEFDRILMTRTDEVMAGLSPEELSPDNVLQREVFEIDLSVVLSYDKIVSIEQFRRNLSEIDQMLRPENFLDVGLTWAHPYAVEQKSMLKSVDFKNFCAGMVSASS